MRLLLSLALMTVGIFGATLRSALETAGGAGIRLPVAVFITAAVALARANVMTPGSIIPAVHTGIAGLMHARLVAMLALPGPAGVIVIAGLRGNTGCNRCEDYRRCRDGHRMNVHEFALFNVR